MSEYQSLRTIERALNLKAIAREMGARAIVIANAGNVMIEQKPDGSKVTGVDKALNQLLIRRAQEIFPDTAVWSEEGSTATYGDVSEIEGRSLVLGDPIDGTDKLVRALQAGNIDGCQSTVLLSAYAPNQTVPAASIVYAPFLPEQPMLWADASGAYREDNTGELVRLVVPSGGPTDLDEVRTYKISRWDGSVPDLRTMSQMLPNARDERNELRLVSVGEGTVDLSIFPGAHSNLHDIIPPLHIARQAGAATMGLDGRPFEELMNGPVHGVLAAVNWQLARRALDYFDSAG